MRFVGLVLAAMLGATVRFAWADDAQFENKVRPVLLARCVACHGENQQAGSLRLDRAISAKQALAVQNAVRWDGAIKMPPSGKLPETERKELDRWVSDGAIWPKAPAQPKGGKPGWPFTSLVRPLAPPVDEATTDMDAFVLAKLKQRGLSLAPPADRRTLIRRVTFDLIGLPPTTTEVEAFVSDTRPDAFARVVDRLLADPRYGERWGRHWLDVARYADSADARGIGGEGDISEAWRYRDWVISAFNRDIPFSDFVTRQIAGDCLHTPDGDIDVDGIVASSFLAIGNWGNGDADKDKILTDIADDQVDTVGKAFLGLTVGCARCHDHKFDPISTKDYYALAGIFFSTHILPRLTPKGAGEVMLRVPLETKAQKQARERAMALDSERNALRSKARTEAAQAQVPQTARYIAALRPGGSADGLDTDSLERWRDRLGLAGPPTLREPMRNIGNVPGVEGVQGSRPALSATVNTTLTDQKILTFTLPARSVSVHPSPQGGVGILWKATKAETVTITTTLKDGDSGGGDGFVWNLKHGDKVLQGGPVDNGGEARTTPVSVTVAPGDTIALEILPRGEYSFDTTNITLKIGSDDLTTAALAHPTDGAFGSWRYVDLAPAMADALQTTFKNGDTVALDKELAAIPLEKSPFLPTDSALPESVRKNLTRLEVERDTLLKTLPTTPEIANGAAEGGVPGSPHEGIHDVAVHKRGRYDTLGDMVPRGVLTVLPGGGPLKISSGGSGRVELARWLTDTRNPLPGRVFVNRVWAWHFGRGLVGTPSNFGKLGDKPTDPELIDWLADVFLNEDGGSIKKLHRRILLSQTYQQSSVASPAALAKDPENLLLSRQNRQRLEAEPLRDALHFVAGTLKFSPGGPAFREAMTPRRAVYGLSVRSDRTGFGCLFDAADPTASIDKRVETTVAPQSLYLLNNPLVLAQADELAKLVKATPGTDATRIDFLYRRLYSRPASESEKRLGVAFLAQSHWNTYVHALLCANEFLYID
ncbi:MAG: DUF1549 domain-containing protein [Armatimonas sp.]